MDNIRNALKILFRYISSVEVIKSDTTYNHVAEGTFTNLANVYMPQYSNNEIINLVEYLGTELEWHNNKIRGRLIEEKKCSVNVFDIVLMFADSVLKEEHGMPVCQYHQLLRWRDTVVILGEDLFITAYLAQKDLLYPIRERRFFWPPVIGHDNRDLNRMMSKGVAENHFHLKGSAPLFHLSWLSLMNDARNPQFKRALDEYDARRLQMKVNYRVKYAEESLYVTYLQALLIRLYLFTYLTDETVSMGDEYVEYKYIKPYISDEAECNTIREDEGVRLSDYEDYLKPEIYSKLQKMIFRKEVEYLLQDTQELQFRTGDIQKCIVLLKQKYSTGKLDYAIWNNTLANSGEMHLNENLSGERWLLYSMFQKIYLSGKTFCKEFNWFYAYLLIKENIRSEMIQANNNVGFHNFLLYQNRKEMFVEGTPFEKVYLKMAVRDTIYNQHIKKLEARITPKDTSEQIRKSIQKNDAAILEGEKDKEGLRKKYFYVCHFIKGEDVDLTKGIDSEKFNCRHYRKRKAVERQSYALYEFRSKGDCFAERIRGIDASSEEIGCRPEVFAQAFRFLKNQAVRVIEYPKETVKVLPDLYMTYHVGEDFLDILDGLRAIDETLSFFNMRCGDRLGHALALGVDVEEWYASKSGYILLPQMDYLDNLVWLYSKIRKYHLDGLEDTLRYIEKRYDEYFRIVYLNHMREEHLTSVMNEAIDYYRNRNIQHNYGNRQCVFSINTYYDSWKLRGDNPEYYQNGYFCIDTFLKSEWEEAGINKEFPENYRIRYNPEAAYLYYTYHYNEAVKQEGNKRKEIKVNPCIIKAVKAVQRQMQRVVAQKGIAIETNPSSNALIGTFKRYDKHPILNWYNIGLQMGNEMDIPQIQVSINTDDQGVFATYIENEYAYLALALEKVKDEHGNQKYNKTLIYNWLDNIREMGLRQSFEEIGE